MLIRYKQDDQGNTLPIANIYTQTEHKIETRNIDRDALWVIKKLQAAEPKPTSSAGRSVI